MEIEIKTKYWQAAWPTGVQRHGANFSAVPFAGRKGR